MAILLGSGHRSLAFAVAAAATETVTRSNGDSIAGVTVTVAPGAGGTALCEYRTSATDAWTAWPGGTVAARTVYVLTGPVQALRFAATTQPAAIHLAT